MEVKSQGGKKCHVIECHVTPRFTRFGLGPNRVQIFSLGRTLNLDPGGCAEPGPEPDLDLWVRFGFGPGPHGPGPDRGQTTYGAYAYILRFVTLRGS